MEGAKLMIQVQLRYPLCVPCARVFMNIGTLKGHLEKKHQERSRDAKKRAEGIAKEAEEGVSNEVFEKRKIYESAPFGKDGEGICGSLPSLLGVEESIGFKCPKCEHYVVRRRSMLQHFQDVHKESVEQAKMQTDSLWKQGGFKVQSLQSGFKTCYFRVDNGIQVENETQLCTPQQHADQKDVTGSVDDSGLAEGSVGHEYDLDFFSAACEAGKSDVLFSEQGEGEGLETHNEFIAATKVPAILKQEGIEVEDAARLTSPSETDGPMQKDLPRLCRIYLEKIANCASTAAPALLNILFPRDEKSFQPVGKSTVKRYSKHIANFLSFAFRAANSAWIGEKTGKILRNYENSYSSFVDDIDRLWQTHKILKLLCLVHRQRSAGVKGMFIRTYFACACVSRSRNEGGSTYRFMEASEVSHCLAAMQHVILGTALLEMTTFNNDPMSDANRVVSDNDDEVAELREKEDRVLLKINRTENNALSFVRIVLNICWGMMKRETADFKFVPCKTHPYCGFIRGVEVSLPFIGRCIRRWQKECQQIMDNELLCGGTYPPDLQEVISHVTDNLQEKGNGYSFLDHPSFVLISENWQKWIMREIAEQGKGANHMFARPGDAAGIWTEKQINETIPLQKHRLYRIAVQRWLGACQRLQEKLLLCLHLSSGSPARATEMSTFRMQNSAYGQRNIYISQNELVSLCRYSKMRSQTGTDNHILRVPDEKTGNLFKKYLLLFRKFESILVGKLYGDESKRGHMHWVFANRGERYCALKIRKIIWGGMAEQGKELGISDVRHFFSEMVRTVARFSVEMKNEGIEEFEDTGHAQAGHSTEVSDRHYGRSTLDFVGLGKRSVERSRLFCVEWHRCLFFWEDERKVVRHRQEFQSSELRNKDYAALINASAVSSTLNEMKTDLKDILKRTANKRDSGATDNDIKNGNFKKRRVIAVQESVKLFKPSERNREKDALKLLPSLRLLLKEEIATFKSAIQADVTAAVLDASEDLLVVMGTGSGKSLCVLLPAFVEGTGYSTIVIVPLAALVVEWKKKCTQLGITAASWQERNTDRAQIYVFAAEHVDNCEYRIFVRTISSEGCLKRVVYDEAHGPITWDDFRPSMFKSRFMLGSANRPIQRVLLSATVPPSEYGILLQAYGMREAYFFAAPTTRNNLGFSVVHAMGTAVGNGVRALLKQLSRSLRAEVGDPLTRNGKMRIMIFVMRISDADSVRNEIEQQIVKEQRGVLLVYHGKMAPEKRAQVQSDWDSQNGEGMLVMICTSAFGAGVDARNVKLVFHFGGSNSLVQFAQECGRAGRNGEHAKCILLWNDSFACRQEVIRSKMAANADVLWEREYEERKYLWWSELRGWVENTSKCRKASLFKYLDGAAVTPCFYDPKGNPCDVCVSVLTGSLDLQASGNVKILTDKLPSYNNDNHTDVLSE